VRGTDPRKTWTTSVLDAQSETQDPALMERILAANPVLDNMGGIIMWPGWQVDGPTMNQARGFGAKARAPIGDRLDLTLECIRSDYTGDFDDAVNPLGSTLTRYWVFSRCSATSTVSSSSG